MSNGVARVSTTSALPVLTRVLVVAVLLLPIFESVHAQPLFEPGIQIGAGIRPMTVAIGDLNGDGWLDLAVGNAGPSKMIVPGWFRDSCYVSVLLGNGDGTFGPRSGFLLGDAQVPTHLVIADLNSDTHQDLVMAVHDPEYGFSGIAILMGNGDGTFPPRTFLNAGTVTSLAVGDLNDDGHPDLVAANQGANAVSVLLGNGDGTFGAITPFATGNQPIDVAIADFNLDGRLDVVTANYIGGSISMLLGNGNGTFAPKIDTVTESAPRALAVGNLDTDDLPDLAVAHFNTIQVSVHHNLGGGAFGPFTGYDAGSNPLALAIGQLDFDSGADLVVAKGSGSTAVLLANSDGSYGPKEDFTPGGFSVAIGDLNGDWEPDVATAAYSADAVSILFNVPDQVLAALPSRLGEGGLDLVGPNPTRNVSQMDYTVARAGQVRLEVSDVAGRVIATLFSGTQSAGRYHSSWDGTGRGEKLPAGLYFVRLTTPGQTFARKLIRLE